MRIREVAAASGLSADTLRYYEEEGLLDQRHARRAANGYRDYTERAVERVAQIRQAQAAGFTLREIRDVLDMLDGGRLTPVAIVKLCVAKLAEVDARLTALRKVQRYLRAKVRQLNPATALQPNRSPPRRQRGRDAT
jgi:MerR family transcriptional regulator, copper efflux regulator